MRRAVCGTCGVLAPVAFAGSWLTAGARTPGYSPVRDHISDLAASGAPQRALMTGGFVAFGLLLPVFARALPGGARGSATLAGVATLAVAALPVDVAPAAHATCAAAAYAGTAASPLLLPGRRLPSYAVGVLSAGALAASLTGAQQGLWQRVGLTVVHAWYVGLALRMAGPAAPPEAGAAGPGPGPATPPGASGSSR